MPGLPETILSWTGCTVTRSLIGGFTISLEGDVAEAANLTEVLKAIAPYSSDEPGPVVCTLGREEVWSAADEAGLDSFFPRAPEGWVKCLSVWVPATMLEDVDDAPQEYHNPVYEAGELGCGAELYEWEGFYVMTASGPEGESRSFQALGRIPAGDAEAAADDAVADLLHEWNLVFSECIGLDNLDEADRFPLPASAHPVRSYSTCLAYDGSNVADVTVYRLDEDGEEHSEIFVTSADGVLVVGEYDSLEEIEETIDVEPGLSLSVEQLE